MDSTQEKNNVTFLSHGGEMGELIRSKDWNNTIIGNPTQWDQSLRIALNILLNSSFPMFLFWGKDLNCFYNDAYRRSLGIEGKHPQILGMKGEDAWPEIWHVIKPLLDKVFYNGESTWLEDELIPIYRNGKLEDVYWTFSYSPVKNETGITTAVLVTCVETTLKVFSVKNLQESKEELEFIIKAADLGAFNYNPLTHVFSANTQLKAWFGFNSESEIDLNQALNIIAKNDRQIVLTAIQSALNYASGGLCDIEYTIINPFNGIQTVVHAKARAWFNDEKIAYKFNGTLQDITPQVISRKKIAESEQRFEAAVKAVKGIVWTNTFDGKMEGEQHGWSQLTGQSYNEYQGYGWAEAVHPDDAQPTIAAWNEAVRERRIFLFEHRVLLRNGAWGMFSVRAIPMFNENGTIREWVGVHIDVTDRYKTEKALRESEERFRNIAENTEIMIAVSNEKNKPTYFNRAWVDLTGLSMQKLLKSDWLDLIHPEDKDLYVNVSYIAMRKKNNFSAEFRMLNKEKEYRWILAKGTPRFLSDQTIAGYITSYIDITDRKTVEVTLKEGIEKQLQAHKIIEQKEERLNIIIEANELGTYELDLVKDHVKTSEKFNTIFGYSKTKKLSHKEWLNHLHPDDMKIRNESFQKSLKDGILHYQSRIIRNDKMEHWIEVKGKIFYGKNNKPVFLIGTCRDISDEKNYRQQLEDREKKFRLLADSMPQHVWTADIKGNMNYFNQSLYDYSGLTTEQINKEGWIQIVHPEDKDENVKVWMDSISTGKNFLFEHRFRKYNGEYRWQLSRATPQKDAYGNIEMWVGTSTDIEDQKTFSNQLENQVKERTQELEHKNIDLEKKNKELQSFAYISSHDLQEPLRKIQTFANRIVEKEYDKLSENGRDSFDRMQNAAKRMQVLINDLLSYSRTSTSERKFEKTSINKVINDVKEDLKDEFIYKKGKIEVTGECELNIIRFQFKQLLNNLFSNALKFSKTEEPSLININIETATGSSYSQLGLIGSTKYCHITIADNGIGFDQIYCDKIFELFQRLHGRSEYSGTGIGLAIVKKIVENHNGIITASGEPNKGAAFDIFIPE
ncbi:MAG: PAS domain-containing protein [Bacteroidia bacterium]|nr:PAS domain-containing protein [Bacteroidia bacterium]